MGKNEKESKKNSGQLKKNVEAPIFLKEKEKKESDVRKHNL